MNSRFALFSLLLVVAGAVIGGLVGHLPAQTSADAGMTSERFLSEYREALKVIDGGYADKIDYEDVGESSMQSMLWALDPHSAFFTSEEFQKLNEEQSSQFYGIGVSILQHRDGVYVQSVIPNTPADAAGLRYGDRILSVDGQDAREWTSGEVSKNVRGRRGTSVSVEIERAASQKPLTFDIVRGGVPLPSIRNYFMLPGGVGYVGLTGGFQQTTGEELNLAITDLKKRGMKSLVLDLRGNPGGILDQAIAVVSKFVPSGQTVVSVKGAGGSEPRTLVSSGEDVETMPLVVMINGGSASASEIVAGAIQDYGRGLVVGSDSFGKGLVQRVFKLPFGTGLTLTTARYYTPFGRSLQRDYSSGSIYEYYSHTDGTAGTEAKEETPAGVPVSTAGGRVLYGGRGIEPDVEVEALTPNPVRARINEAAFFFVRQLAAGQVEGFEKFRVEKQNFRHTLQASEFSVTDSLYAAFGAFAAADKKNGLTTENFTAHSEHARRRIREELVTANYSTEAGVQVLLEADPQILKALDLMPKARELAMAYTAANSAN